MLNYLEKIQQLNKNEQHVAEFWGYIKRTYLLYSVLCYLFTELTEISFKEYDREIRALYKCKHQESHSTLDAIAYLVDLGKFPSYLQFWEVNYGILIIGLNYVIFDNPKLESKINPLEIEKAETHAYGVAREELKEQL